MAFRRRRGGQGGVVLAPGLSLLPGEDGTLPVRSRWVVTTDGTEALAIHEGDVYVAGFEIRAIRIGDGSVKWVAGGEDDEALEASGGVVVGFEGDDVVRVFAPWTYDMRLRRADGVVLSMELEPDGEPPAGLRAERPSPRGFTIESGLNDMTAFWPDGRSAWKLHIDHPQISPKPAIGVEDAVLCATSSDHLVLLDPVEPPA
jgi:hypothetical protein